MTHHQLDRTDLHAESFDAITTDGLHLKGLFVCPTVSPIGTAIVLHGLWGNKESELWLARELFAPEGINTIVYDARAHGESDGQFCILGLKEAQDVGQILTAAEKKFGSLGKVGVFG